MDPWKVANYTRNGRSQQAEIFTKVQGKLEKNSITVRVIGVDLRNNATLLLAEITNRTGGTIDAITGPAPAFVVGSHQYQAGVTDSTGQGGASVVAGATLEVAYYALSGLPLSTRSLRP